MANKYFKQFFYTLEQMPVMLNARLKRTGATAGTAVYSVEDGKGIGSFVRNDAGEYEIILDDKYNNLLSSNFVLAFGTETDLRFQIEAIDLDAKSIKFFALTDDTATDMPDGSEIYVQLVLRNSAK